MVRSDGYDRWMYVGTSLQSNEGELFWSGSWTPRESCEHAVDASCGVVARAGGVSLELNGQAPAVVWPGELLELDTREMQLRAYVAVAQSVGVTRPDCGESPTQAGDDISVAMSLRYVADGEGQ